MKWLDLCSTCIDIHQATACCYKVTLAPEKGGDPLAGRITGNSTLSLDMLFKVLCYGSADRSARMQHDPVLPDGLDVRC